MSHLELFVKRFDGSGRVIRTERDTPEDRRSLDKAAFAEMARTSTHYATVTVTDRTAQTGRGRYR